MATISETVTKDWLTKAEFASELQTNINNLNQILTNGPKAKKFPKASGIYMQKRGRENVYSPKYIELVKASRPNASPSKKAGAGPVKTIKSPDSASLTVPVYKKQLAVLESLGITEEKLVSKLKSVVDELYKKAQVKLDELKNSIDL